MKTKNVSKSALVLLAIGLLVTSLTLIVNRYLPLPDLLKGFLTGLGLTAEVIALIKIDRYNKKSKCANLNN